MIVAGLMTEEELKSYVFELAKYTGWLYHHQRPALLSNGEWRSTIEGDKGFQDLVLARDGIVLPIELKSEKGKLTPEQEAWQKAAHGLVWRPRDMRSGEIERMLVRRAM